MTNRDSAQEAVVAAKAPALVEFHDARLAEAIKLVPGGEIRIELSRVSTYHENRPEHYAVFSRSASLVLSECAEFHVLGQVDRDAVVSDVEMFNGDEESDLTEYLSERPVSTVIFTFTNGTRVALLARSGHLLLSQPRQRLRDWEGPLITIESTNGGA